MNQIEIINYLKRNNGSGHIVEHVGWHESGDYLLRLLFETHDKPFRQHKYEVENEYHVIPKEEVDALEKQTCGRRMNDFGPWTHEENIDFWKPGEHRTCSFCGSLHPDDVLSIVREHGPSAIGGTDKSYKWYIQHTKKYYRHHDTQEFIDALNALMK